MAPRNTLSVSSRNSWKDTTALRCGSSWGHSGRKGVGKQSHHRPALREPQQHLRCPSCQGHPCPATPGPAGCSADGQTNTQQRIPENPNKAAFPTEKPAGKEKQERETTRKTPLSPSQGSDAIESPAPRDGTCSASSHPARARRDEGAGGHSPPPHSTAPSQRAPGTRPFTGVLPRHPFS